MNGGQDGHQSIETLSRRGVMAFEGNPKYAMYFLFVMSMSIHWCGR